MPNWIDLSPPATRVMNSIGFNNFFYLINYMIKIYANKMEHQPQNRYLFETIIPIKKQNKIHNSAYFPTNAILKDEIKN